MENHPYGTAEADTRVYAAIRAFSDLLTSRPCLPAVDPADVRGLVADCGGVAVAGHGVASGLGRAARAAEMAMQDLQDQVRALRAGKAE